MMMTQTTTIGMPKITILAAAWNERQNITGFIQSFQKLDLPHIDLIMCAGGVDGTFEEAAKHISHSIQVLQQFPREGKQAALRKGFQYATGEIILLTDTDCLLNEDSLKLLVQPIINGESQVTSGHSVPKQSHLNNPFIFYQYAMDRRWEAALQRKKYLKALLGRNCAMRRSVLEEVGAFDEDVAIGTDSYLAKKFIAHGYEIRFVPASVVETDYSKSIKAYLRQRSRWRRNGIIHNLRFGHYRRVLRAVFITLRGLMMVLLPLIGLLFSPLVLYFWLALVLYSFLFRAKQVHALRKIHAIVSSSIYWKIFPYMFSEWAAQALGLVQLLSPRARNTW